MKAIKVDNENYKNISAESHDGRMAINHPFYIVENNGLVFVISDDMKHTLNEQDSMMVISDKYTKHYYDMRTEWNVHLKSLENVEFVEIIENKGGYYEPSKAN